MENLQELMDQKASGELTMNQAYKKWSNAGGTGSFKDFMANATNKGWIDQGLNAISAYTRTKYGDTSGGALITDTPCLDGFEKDSNGICQPIKKGMSTIAMVGIGVALIGVIAGVVYLSKQKGK